MLYRGVRYIFSKEKEPSRKTSRAMRPSGEPKRLRVHAEWRSTHEAEAWTVEGDESFNRFNRNLSAMSQLLL